LIFYYFQFEFVIGNRRFYFISDSFAGISVLPVKLSLK